MARTLQPLDDAPAGDSPDESGVRSVDRRTRVLVVDDEPMIGASLKRILSALHDVTVLTSGRDALAAIRDGEAFDVVICDVMMPALSGLEVYEAVRETHPAAAERFVFITGGVLHEEGRRFLESVPNPVVFKPFDIATVRALVWKVARIAG